MKRRFDRALVRTWRRKRSKVRQVWVLVQFIKLNQYPGLENHNMAWRDQCHPQKLNDRQAADFTMSTASRPARRGGAPLLNVAGPVEAMPPALHLHGAMPARNGQAGSQRRVWSAAIVMQ